MKKNYLITWVIALLINGVIDISCSKSSSSNTNPPAGGTTGSAISIYNMSFSPSSKTVAIGTVVKWTNNDGYPHTVTSNDGTSFDSGNMSAGGTYSYTPMVAGTYAYHCTIHGMAMSGTLIVTP